MLVLSRTEQQRIVINGNIVITVVQIDTHRVKLGIDAPENVEIWRGEIQRVKDRQNLKGGK